MNDEVLSRCSAWRVLQLDARTLADTLRTLSSRIKVALVDFHFLCFFRSFHFLLESIVPTYRPIIINSNKLPCTAVFSIV